MSRARVLVMNSALGPLDYRVPEGMQVEPGSVVVAVRYPARRTAATAARSRLPPG